VDCIVNSAMPFELPILKNKLFRFPGAIASSGRPKTTDAYLRAKRVLDLFNPMTAVTDDRASRCAPDPRIHRGSDTY